MRLVDADKQLEWVDCMKPIHGIGLEPVVAVETVRDLIKGAPTIDAIPVAKYKAEIETLRSRCYPGAEDAFGRKAYGCLKIVPVSYGTKSVDAIPVEWMREKMRGYASALKSTETAALVMVMQMWQKEQEGV